MISKHLIPVLATLLVISTTGSATFGWLYLNARDAIIEEREQCNVSKLSAIAEAERITRQAVQANADRQLAQLARRAADAERGRQIAEEVAADAKAEVANHEVTIRELELEGFTDDIPDSKECLNAYMLEPSVERLRLQAEDCGEVVSGGNSRTDSVCAGAVGLNTTDPLARDFAAITYGDAIILWGRDRQSLKTCNGRLEAVRSLDNGEQG